MNIEDGIFEANSITLSNLIYNLENIFPTLEALENKSIVCAFGDSGIGKSTLLNSLVYGPDVLID